MTTTTTTISPVGALGQRRRSHFQPLATTAHGVARPSPIKIHSSTSSSKISRPDAANNLVLPPIILTTPDDEEDQEDSILYPRALLAEPPPTPTRESSGERDGWAGDGEGRGLTLEAFPDEGYSLVIGPSDEDGEHVRGSGLVSPFADPEEEDQEEEEEDFISYWSFSSSSSASSSEEEDDDEKDDDEEEEERDDDEEEPEFPRLRRYDSHAPVRIVCTDVDGLTSFPSLPPCAEDDDGDDMVYSVGGREPLTAPMMMMTPPGKLYRHRHGTGMSERGTAEHQEDVDDKDDQQGPDSVTMELIEAVEAVQSDYQHDAETWAWTTCGGRGPPRPSWAWLRSSNSFPKYRLGPNDLHHGPSKLRMAWSAGS